MAKGNAMIAALDIGTKSVTTLIAQKSEDGVFSIIGKGVKENNKGLIAGDVVDVQATAAAIRESVAEAEQISSKRIKKVYFGLFYYSVHIGLCDFLPSDLDHAVAVYRTDSFA